MHSVTDRQMDRQMDRQQDDANSRYDQLKTLCLLSYGAIQIHILLLLLVLCVPEEPHSSGEM